MPSSRRTETVDVRPGTGAAAWRTVDMFVPTSLNADEFGEYIQTHIRGIAHEGGEFIDRMVVQNREMHSHTWWRCSVAYLPGPPGAL